METFADTNAAQSSTRCRHAWSLRPILDAGENRQIAAAVQEQLRELQRQRDELEAGFSIKSQHIQTRLMELTKQNMLQQYDLQLSFLQQIVLELGTET